jgi:hypothetical protein
MKKFLSIFLLVIFLFNLAGYFIVFKVIQYSVQQEMKVYLQKNSSDKETEIITIPTIEIASPSSRIKFTDDDEFIYNGKLYDIISSKSSNGYTTFYCMNDKQEEQLYSTLKDHIIHNTDQNLPLKDRSTQIIKNIIKEALADKCIIKQQLSILSCKINFDFDTTLLRNFKTVLSPPPKA